MKRMTTLRYVNEAIATFNSCPPKGRFEKGYLQALIDARDKK